MDPKLKPYLKSEEIALLGETDSWLKKDVSKLKKALSFTRKPIEFVYQKVPESIRDSISDAILKVLVSVRDGSTKFHSKEKVLDKIREQHGPINSKKEHFQVGVETIDTVVRKVVKQSQNACTAEGAVTGVAGLPGIVADVPALYALLFRMIAQVATCYGFDPSLEEERLFMLKILDVGHRTELDSKRAGMEELELALESGSPEDIQKTAVQKGLQNMARHLGLALTQRKLTQSIVLIGGIVGAGVNRGLAGDVGEVALHSYRRRHLADLL